MPIIACEPSCILTIKDDYPALLKGELRAKARAVAERCFTFEEFLEKRLAEPDGPEIILVLRLLSHGWLEEHTMHILRTRLIERLRKSDKHGRFHVYYPHVPGLAAGCCLDVHSKLMIVDDRMLRIGSSNLCNRSFGLDTEADAAIEVPVQVDERKRGIDI